ncbi:MAG: hypothetical protein ACJ8GO_19600 [Ramlibacter sp.]
MILSFTALQLLGEWEHAHRQASQAEFWAARSHGTASTTSPGIAETAAELRAFADASFRRLLDAQAFGELRPMPKTD